MREQARPTLPKWPFYFGDLLLVSTAILIAFNGGGALNGWQFFWCFASVVSGAVLFVVPFVLEFRGQLTVAQARQEGVSQEMARRLHVTMTEVQELKDVLSEHNEQQVATMALLDSTIKDLQDRLSSITEPQGGIEALTEELRKITVATEQMELLAEEEQQAEAAPEEQQAAVTFQDPVVLEKEATTTPAPETVTETPAPTTQAFDANADLSSDIFLDDLPLGGDLVLPEDTPVQASEETSFEAAPTQEEQQEQPTWQPEETVAEVTPEPTAIHPHNDEPFILDELGPVGAGRDASALVHDEAPAATATATVVAQPTEAHVDAHGHVEPANPEETVRRAHTGQTKVIANVLTGIGKKPYIRGEGPGLSWEKGIPMDFVEIGKWQWVAPHSDQPVQCHIYKDDNIPAEGENFQLEPGEQLELSPHFSS
tara:strand:- start:19808 stop:21088 length:1281 start_codon:yes stop_codon:yes gene_type:complete